MWEAFYHLKGRLITGSAASPAGREDEGIQPGLWAALFSDFSCSNFWLFWRLLQTQGPIFSAGLSFLMCCCWQKEKKVSGSCKRNLGLKAPFIMQMELVYQ